MTLEQRATAALAAMGLSRRSGAATVLGAGSDDVDSGRAYLAAAAAGGWMLPTWPRAHGGMDATAAEASIIASVREQFALPDMYPFHIGLHLVGPLLLDAGTPDQQQRWMGPIARGEEIWCQMFSEPNAGSDLANVGTVARAVAGGWRLSGQKVWTSRGPYARWGVCLARTDVDVPKHRGLTMFAVDMDLPTVDVRPLHQMNGDTHFSEVFLEEVPIPDADRIAPVGAGWQMALRILALERVSLAGKAGSGSLDASGEASLIEAVDATNPLLRDRLLRAVANGRVDRIAGETGPGSAGKLRTVASFKECALLRLHAQAAEGMVCTTATVPFLSAPSMSIRGGTDEIQRNILGERILGLPPEPRVDKDDSYRELRRKGLA